MHDPMGRSVPGGVYCLRHGSEIAKEYKEKLGELWTLRDLPRRETA
ncbi:hypothetical protein [Deferrisoma camini]|nr:hypothetical protein [Deferrisoma camini]